MAQIFSDQLWSLQNCVLIITKHSCIMKVFRITHKVLSKFSSSAVSSPDYQHLSSIYSQDLKMHLHQYSHKKTNARIYHFENKDPQNTYASIVKTFVQSDKGCPHILQHLACCGSQKYPIRDPFFNMIKRSVNSYMNAWTGDDFTSYPFASANPKDWQNLYKVYLDMSLKPLLNELDFRQQGWRYELNEKGSRELKGIVFNQMKGAYQDSDRQLIKQINQQLFRGTPYIYDSGGRPNEIVNLQYIELIKMYEYYYHPSNMAFYFYGNNPISKSLEYLSTQYLNHYQNQSHIYNKINLKPEPIQNKYKDVISYTSESNNISINYFLGTSESLSPVQALSLRIITYLLLQKSNALIYKKFIETGIAQNIGFSGFNEAKMLTFTVTLKGIYPDYKCQQFQNHFKQVIQEIIQKGVDMERVKQFTHQFQVNLLTPRQNNGIKILQESLNIMNHRLNFESYLNPRPVIEQALLKLNERQFVRELLSKTFLQNKQMVVVRQLLAQKQSTEQQITSSVLIQDSKIRQQQEQLILRQNEKQDINILPMLKIEDIIKSTRISPSLVSNTSINNKQYQQYHIKITEDINFYRLVFNFDKVDLQFLKKITLWVHTLNKIISTQNYSYSQLTSNLANHTAGFNVLTAIGSNSDLNIIFQFSCLKKNINTAFKLLEEMLLFPKFQKQHTLNGYRSFASQSIEELIQNPMNECLNEASSQLTVAGSILNSYQRIKQSLALVKDERIEDLYQISLWITKCNNIRLIEHSNQNNISTPSLIDKILKFQSQIMTPYPFSAQNISKAITYNYMVNFCTQQFIAPKYLSIEHAHLNLLLQLLQQDYLHPLIRQKGGAYGSGAKIRNNGTITLSSYLDPNPVATFQIFQNSIKQILSKDTIQNQKLIQAKIKQFGQVDRNKVPQQQGVNQILKRYSVQDYELFRQTLKNSTFLDIVSSGRTYLANKTTSRCIFGKEAPPNFIEQKLKNFLP